MIDDMDDPEDVDCGLEPTPGMMERYRANEFYDAFRNIAMVLCGGPLTARSAREQTLHAEGVIARVLSTMREVGLVERTSRGWSYVSHNGYSLAMREIRWARTGALEYEPWRLACRRLEIAA